MQDSNAQKCKNRGIAQDILAHIEESYLDSRKENYEMNDILLFTKICHDSACYFPRNAT